MEAPKVVLYPFMGVSHMIPMIQLAKLFLKHSISIYIAVINPPTTRAATAKLISKVSSTNPQISFHLLPRLSPPREPALSQFSNMFAMIRSNNAELKSYLQSLAKSITIAALIVDYFCVDGLDVAAELGIPAYIFYTSGANDLAVFLSIPELLPTWDLTNNDASKIPIFIPGIPQLHVSDTPHFLQKFGTKDQELSINVFRRMPEAKGILMNTFELLEPRAVKTLKDGLTPSTQSTPLIYCVGPLVTATDDQVDHPCLRWLDAQPKNSVVFLCFGSRGYFSVDQLRETAFGIEKSGCKFIWVVCNPRSNDMDRVPYDPLADPDLDVLLPEGFLGRTKEQGIVVKSWAPQVEILHHESVGGFVSHCGWSSILEAVTNAVPIICWPLAAEQKMNRVFLVNEMKVGVALEGCDEGWVPKDELAEKMIWLMESEGGTELRNNICSYRINGLEALREGGLSEAAFLEFLETLSLQRNV